jgi:hypothetical protein
MTEAWLTLAYFAILCVVAFAADKFNAYLEEKKKTQDDIEKEETAQEQAIKKGQLRKLVNKLGQSTVIEVGQGVNSKATQEVSGPQK